MLSTLRRKRSAHSPCQLSRIYRLYRRVCIRTGDYWDDMTKDTENPEKWYEKAVRDWNRRVD